MKHLFRSPAARLFWASFAALYFELIIIRYLGTEIRIFSYFKNLPLIASFLGLGLGMISGKASRRELELFPLIGALLFLLIAFAGELGLTHLPVPGLDQFLFGQHRHEAPLRDLLCYVGVVFLVCGLVIAFCTVLGGLVGAELANATPLRAYGINLLGSLAGIVVLTIMSFLWLPPVVWLTIGLVILAPFLERNARTYAAGAVIVAATIFSASAHTYWSPYYRISFEPLPGPATAGYHLTVNYDYHQRAVNLSPEFLAAYPDYEPNRSARANYEFPYQLIREPGSVLVVGAGTGNDVAAALRHGATSVDAVEIDPVILQLGSRYHPEAPYSSPRVTAHLDDARSYFKKSDKKFDLIIFAYLDSHTAFSALSSLRLDNYVYTLESFQEARRLLREGGTMMVSFGFRDSFTGKRMYRTLTEAFGRAPKVYETGYDGAGLVFIPTAGADLAVSGYLPVHSMESVGAETISATDDWPYIYLLRPSIPSSTLVSLGIFLGLTFLFIKKTTGFSFVRSDRSAHFFFLGAGFLLLETKAVTELSLLFGSTWVVNALVIATFLAMALSANWAAMRFGVSTVKAYAALGALLCLGILFPLPLLSGLPLVAKVGLGALLVGLPVFFSGLIFSKSFRTAPVPAEALGINLLGAIFGGLVENAVTIVGMSALGFLALALYTASAVSLRRNGWSS